jgi:hypothetical protein
MNQFDLTLDATKDNISYSLSTIAFSKISDAFFVHNHEIPKGFEGITDFSRMEKMLIHDARSNLSQNH